MNTHHSHDLDGIATMLYVIRLKCSGVPGWVDQAEALLAALRKGCSPGSSQELREQIQRNLGQDPELRYAVTHTIQCTLDCRPLTATAVA